MNELFTPPPAKASRERQGPLMERIEKHFRARRYESITTQDLFESFPEDRIDSIRNAVRKLLKDRTIKSTGMVRHSNKLPQPQPVMDVACLTLTIGK